MWLFPLTTSETVMVDGRSGCQPSAVGRGIEKEETSLSIFTEESIQNAPAKNWRQIVKDRIYSISIRYPLIFLCLYYCLSLITAVNVSCLSWLESIIIKEGEKKRYNLTYKCQHPAIMMMQLLPISIVKKYGFSSLRN